MTRAALLLVTCLATTAAAEPAPAPTIVETSHTAEVTLDDVDVVTWTIQRTFTNAGQELDSMEADLELPPGGVVRGARLREENKPWAIAGLVTPVQDGTRVKSGPRLDVAWLNTGFVTLAIAPLEPGARVTVEYTVVASTSFVDGQVWALYPRLSLDEDPAFVGATPIITVRSARIATVDAAATKPDAQLTAHAAKPGDDYVELAFTRQAFAGPWAGRFGTVAIARGKSFARFELDAAAAFSKLPVKAQIVFAVDASYSMGDDGVAAQLALIRQYLAHVPDAEVEVIAYRRTATRVFGAFLPVREALARLEPKAFPLGNGSHADLAVDAALALLAPRTGPRRIVLGSDARIRTALSIEAFAKRTAKVPPDVVVHLVEPDGSDDETLTRGTGKFAEIAHAGHGIHATFGTAISVTGALPLVRPLVIEHLVLTGAKLEDGLTTLVEGGAIRVVTLGTSAPTSATLTGMLWGDQVKLVVPATPAMSQHTLELVFGATDWWALTDVEQLALAKRGGVVSPMTRLAITPPDAEGSSGRVAAKPNGGGPGFGRRAIAPRVMMRANKPVQPASAIDVIDGKACLAKHPGKAVDLAIEVTGPEIVDVIAGKGDASLGACLVELGWAARVPEKLAKHRETYRATYR